MERRLMVLWPGLMGLLTIVACSAVTVAEQEQAADRAVPEIKLYATGDAKMVWINPARGRSIPLPDNMRALAEEE